VRVLCLNLWNLNQPLQLRMDRLDAAVAARGFDLLLLQEVSPAPGSADPAPWSCPSLRGLSRVYVQTGEWEGRPEGLAVLTAGGISSVRSHRLPGGAGDMDRGLLHVTATIGGRPVHAMTTHLAFREEDESLRVAQARAVARVVADVRAAHPEDVVVLGGDLNDVPGSAAVRVLTATGLRSACTGEQARRPTFAAENPWVGADQRPGRRLDHLLVSPQATVVSARVVLDGDADRVSDHYGLEVDLLV
jgi:endonuclease/exonuclease/phosphatase family metal-dependent hydrolase